MCQMAQTKPVYLQIYTNVGDIFKQANLMDRAILQGFWLATEKSNFTGFSETDLWKFLGLTSPKNNL